MKRKVFAYLFIPFVVISCKKENAGDCFKSNGSEITITRDVGSFQKIKLFDKVFLNIKQGPEYKLEITAGKHLMSNISTDIVNNVLIIGNHNKCNFVRGYKNKITVNLTVPKIDSVDNRGVGDIVFDSDFVQGTIFIHAENVGDTYLNGTFHSVTSASHGAGDMYVSGTSDSLFVFSFGTNFFYGQGLTVKAFAFLENISIGDCYVNAPDNGVLGCNIHSNGNVYYYGNPAVINNYSSENVKGKLIKK
jgi:hypothetical protein